MMARKKRRGSLFERARLSRLAAVQAFYQIIQREQSSAVVISEFMNLRFPSEEYIIKPDLVLFQSLVSGAEERRAEILSIIQASLNSDWRYERLECVLKAVLYIASAELLNRLTDVPAPVIITEYVEITHSFYEGKKETAFINGYLDRLARHLGYAMSRHDESSDIKKDNLT